MNHVYGNTTKDGNYFPSGLIVDHCKFVNCRAEDRYNPADETHYGGAICTRATIVDVNDSYFEKCASTLREGGALYCCGRLVDTSGETADRKESKTTITNTTFKDCSANTFGGAVLSAANKLEIKENTQFINCSSKNNGGAVAHRQGRGGGNPQDTSISDTSFSDCNAAGTVKDKFNNDAYGGGALWTRAVTVSITDCEIENCTAAKNGGGVYLYKQSTSTSTGTITNGEITGCQAVKGSAVYVEDKAYFSGNLSVSENIVSDINSGAIHAVDGGKLYFGGYTKTVDNASEEIVGNVKVEGNTCSADSAYDHDVLMQINNVTIINTTVRGLGEDANIGVYVPDQHFSSRGVESMPFGTWEKPNDFLGKIFNDRDDNLFGYQLSVTDKKIYWGSYVCKITDGAGNILKRTNGSDAVYQRLSVALDEFNLVTNESGETGKAVYIKMLVEDYAIRQQEVITNFPDANVTLTTAGKNDSSYPYKEITEGSVCTIWRSNSTNQLFKLDNVNATFCLENITLDGRKAKSATQGDHRLIEAVHGNLFINGGTTMRYGRVTGKDDKGGAIHANTGASLTINSRQGGDIRFEHCYANWGGGAISAFCAMQITRDSTDHGNTYFDDCYSTRGGAILLNANKNGTNDDPDVSLSVDGSVFTNCHSVNEGGAIFNNNKSNTETAYTRIMNSSFTNCYTVDSSSYSSGGAIAARCSILEMDSCHFENCHALLNGGAINHGIDNKSSGNRISTTITNTDFVGCTTSTGNNTYGYGGAVYTNARNLAMTGGSVTGSVATRQKPARLVDPVLRPFTPGRLKTRGLEFAEL